MSNYVFTFPTLLPDHLPSLSTPRSPSSQEPSGGWESCGQGGRQEEKRGRLAPPRLFVPCLWGLVLQELRNTKGDQDGKHFLASAPGKSEPQYVCVSWHCHKNIHAFINTLWLFLVRSVHQPNLPHSQTKAWVSTTKGHRQPLKWEDVAKKGRVVFMATLLPYVIIRERSAPEDCSGSPKISLCKNKSKQTSPFFLLQQLQTSNKPKSLCLPIKYLGLNFGKDWNVLEIHSSTSWEFKDHSPFFFFFICFHNT